MRVPIQMPQLGESIAEATVKVVNVSVGDTVISGQDIIEVETEKAVMEVTTPQAGEVAEITAEVDVSYPVGATLGYLEVEGEEPPAEKEPTQPEDKPHFAPDDQFKTAPAAKPSTLADPEPDTLSVEPTVKGLPVPAEA